MRLLRFGIGVMVGRDGVLTCNLVLVRSKLPEVVS
jgi:hypothetical protein